MKEGWEYKNLGEVADFFRGLTYGKQDCVPTTLILSQCRSILMN